MVHFFNCLWYSSLLTLDRQQFRGGKWNARCADERSVAVKMEAATANHMSEPQHNQKSKPHKCTVCNKRFSTERYLSVHIQMHTKQKSYLCPQCEKCYNSSDSLTKHMYIHSDKYKCSECEKCFHSNADLTIHWRTHSGEKPFECSACGKRCTTAGNLTRHNRIHSGEKPFKCQVCQKSFVASTVLNIHMRVHTGDKPYNCSLCNKSFSCSSTLERHKRRIHSDRKPYHCPFCGKLFKITDNLMSHIRVHAATKEFSCRHCSESFRWRETLKSHLLKSHNEGTWFTCHICQMKFSCKYRLKYVDMKVWSGMFVMNVISVSIPMANWNNIRWNTLTSKDFAVVCVAKNLNAQQQLNSTFEVVQMSMDLMKTLLYRLHVTADCCVWWPQILNSVKLLC